MNSKNLDRPKIPRPSQNSIAISKPVHLFPSRPMFNNLGAVMQGLGGMFGGGPMFHPPPRNPGAGARRLECAATSRNARACFRNVLFHIPSFNLSTFASLFCCSFQDHEGVFGRLLGKRQGLVGWRQDHSSRERARGSQYVLSCPSHNSINDCHFNRNRHSLDLFHCFVCLPSVESLGDGDLPHPTIFQIENFKSYRMSHCGVLEYSAHDRAAYLPKWVWPVMNK
jgi:hypothetical protein